VQYVTNEFIFKHNLEQVNKQGAVKVSAYVGFLNVCDLAEYFPCDDLEYSVYINMIIDIVERTADRYLGIA
jgi:hypothetical protein